MGTLKVIDWAKNASHYKLSSGLDDSIRFFKTQPYLKYHRHG